MDAIKQIKQRIYLTYFMVCLLGLAIMVQVLRVQFVQGEELRKKAEEHTLVYREVEAIRGNIYDANYNLIATSVPVYDIFCDINAGPITKNIFDENVDSLAIGLANVLKDKPRNQYRRELVSARRTKDRFLPIKKGVSHDDMLKLKKLPIFRLGKYKGGLIIEQKSKRQLPFGILAARAIGLHYADSTARNSGLENTYNDVLKGTGGKRLMEKMAGGLWKPVNDENSQEPENGKDIISTIDINLQDVAENELMKKLQETGAAYGCVVLMEVATGDVKAMANLKRGKDGQYRETYNYAIAGKTEPGSTFKLMSLIAGMEDGLISPNQLQETYGGYRTFCDGKQMRDAHGSSGKISIQQSFEMSSNVVIASALYNAYNGNPQKLYNRFKAMHITEPTGIDIPGELNPNIKDPSKQYWSCTSIPWMAHGYELELTPLQTLTFYNAVANNGKMVKPRLVKEIRYQDKVVETFAPTVLGESVCSPATAAKARKMMEGVVQGEHGTAKKLRECLFKVGGKTGTAVMKQAGGYSVDGQKAYNASFCGYFPADAPKYSCIVFISNPVQGGYYAAEVALPVFKAVADKVYALDLDFHRPQKDSTLIKRPITAKGAVLDVEEAAKNLGYNVAASGDGPWATATVNGKSASVRASAVSEKSIPDVTGMSLKDALFLLENVGVKVKVIGFGKVVKQSAAAGSAVDVTQPVMIELAQ